MRVAHVGSAWVGEYCSERWLEREREGRIKAGKDSELQWAKKDAAEVSHWSVRGGESDGTVRDRSDTDQKDQIG
jgi:hypothetical protein